jgi:hypothetical protein
MRIHDDRELREKRWRQLSCRAAYGNWAIAEGDFALTFCEGNEQERLLYIDRKAVAATTALKGASRTVGLDSSLTED